MLRFMKWTLFVLLAVAGTALLFREQLFRALFHFSDLRERPSTGPRLPESAPASKRSTNGTNDVGASIDAALELTADALTFSTGHVRNDATSALKAGKANCIGYAAVFKADCDQRLAEAGLSGEWRVLHMRGALYCGSFNMHRLFSSPFWKDHDICVVENRQTGQRIHVDPTLFDAAGIRRVSGPPN